MPLKPGTMLGPYEILSQIGAGGMGLIRAALRQAQGHERSRMATVMERPPKLRLLAIAADSTTNRGKLACP